MTFRRHIGAFAVLASLGFVAAACGSGGKPTPPSAVLPPAPPPVVGIVTLIGSGSAEGTGTTAKAIDLSTGIPGATKTLSVGTFPDAVAVDSKLHRAYIANYLSNSIVPINFSTGVVGSPIAVGNGPAGVAIAPDGEMAYVTDAGQPGSIGDTVTPVDLRTAKALPAIRVGDGPQGIAITSDGTMAYVADAGAVVKGQSGAIGHTVTPIDLTTGKALARIDVGNGPIAIAATSDGATVFVANTYSGSVTPITVATNAPGIPIELTGAPEALAVAPDDETVWAADASSSVANGNNITPIDVSNSTAGTPIAVGKNPTSLAITPNGATAWVVCSGSGTLVPVELPSGSVNKSATVTVSGGPYAIALGSDSGLLRATHPKKVAKKA